MGAPGSIYVTKCSVKQEVTGQLCYKATGSFILNPGRFLKEAFRDKFIKQNLIHLWSSIDTNGDDVISHQELDHFIANSDAVNINGLSTQFLFAFIDRDGNGEISFDELTYFYDNLDNKSKVSELCLLKLWFDLCRKVDAMMFTSRVDILEEYLLLDHF